jgi:hypothetical protein
LPSLTFLEAHGNAYADLSTYVLDNGEDHFLYCNILQAGYRFEMGVVSTNGVQLFSAPNLMVERSIPYSDNFPPVVAAWALPRGEWLAMHRRGFSHYNQSRGCFTHTHSGGWQPASHLEFLLCCAPLSWMTPSANKLEIAGTDEEGHLYVSEVELADGTIGALKAVLHHSSPFVAAALLGPGRYVTVTEEAVYQVRKWSGDLRITGRTPVKLSLPIACIPNLRSKELTVVCAIGTVVKVPISV